MAQIAQIKTVPLSDPAGEALHGVMVAVNSDPDGLDLVFTRVLAEKIALQRMCSPPDTSVLLVSVIGTFDIATFVQHWRDALGEPKPEMKALRFFLERMTTADVVHGQRDGTVLGTATLHL